MKLRFINLLSFIVICIALVSCSDNQTEVESAEQNKDNTADTLGYYTIPIEDQLSVSPDSYPKELIYFFSYGCEHCNSFEPFFELFKDKHLPDWVKLRYIPISVKPEWLDLAKFYYALDHLQVEANLKSTIFATIHPKDKKYPQEEYFKMDKLVAFAEKNGVDGKQLRKLFNDEQLLKKVEQEAQLISQFTVRTTPTLVYDGKFLIEPRIANPHGGILQVLHDIIQNNKPK